MKLFTRYLNSTAVFSPPDDNAAAIAAERDSIQVETMKPEDKLGGEVEDTNETDDKTQEGEENEEDESEDGEEEENEEVEKEETAEEKEARIAEAKIKRKEDRQQRRIDKATAEAKQAKDELAALRRQMAENPKEGLTEEEVDRRAEEKAAKKIAAAELERQEAEFDKSIARLANQGEKADKDFSNKIDTMAKEVAPIPRTMILALDELDNKNGGEVLTYLANNVDEYEEFFTKQGNDYIPVSERKMTRLVDKLSDKLHAEKQVKPKAKTRVPPPVGEVEESGGKGALVLTGKEDMDSFARTRQRQIEERRKARGY